MNEGQKKFYGFIMNMVKEDSKDEAEKILAECFRKQDEGTFTKKVLEETMPLLKSVVREDGIKQLEAAMVHFSSNLKD